MILPNPVMVSDQQNLEACVEQCFRVDAIAVDTEFVRTDTFYPNLGLIQISDGEQVWLVDPLAFEDFSVLEKLFLCPDVMKVFHSCSEDLEVMQYSLGLVPRPLFDTQTAAAFLNYGFSRGYSALVDAVLGIQLDKHETRSDWLQRPLSAAQQQYAAEDVYFLIKVYRELETGLHNAGRDQWMIEEMAELMERAAQPTNVQDYYLRVKGAWKLSEPDLALLRDLTSWREQEARNRNRPRNRVLSDKALMELLRIKPNGADGLHAIEGFHRGVIRRYGETIMKIVHGEPNLSNLQKLPTPLDREGRALLSDCRTKLKEVEEKQAVAVELLARKKDLEPLVKSAIQGTPQLPERLARGWRHDLVGVDLLAFLQSRSISDG